MYGAFLLLLLYQITQMFRPFLFPVLEQRFSRPWADCSVLSISLFQRNGDGDPAHHIVELKVPFRAEEMTVVAVDTDR